MENPFLPKEAKILHRTQETADEIQLTLRFVDESKMEFEPGQFLEVGLFGYGEIPIGIASSPNRSNTFDIVVRGVGTVSQAIHKLQKGEYLTVRGPFGKGFHLEQLRGHDLLIIAGGIGLCPTRSLILYVMEKREEFNDFTLFYGARTPQHQMFQQNLAQWRASDKIDFYETVDHPDSEWTGHAGVITRLFEVKEFSLDTKVIICGPPIMFKFITEELKRIGLPQENIFLDMERRMKCGIGKCGHCQINDQYVCTDGPVFRYDQVKHLPEAMK